MSSMKVSDNAKTIFDLYKLQVSNIRLGLDKYKAFTNKKVNDEVEKDIDSLESLIKSCQKMIKTLHLEIDYYNIVGEVNAISNQLHRMKIDENYHTLMNECESLVKSLNEINQAITVCNSKL